MSAPKKPIGATIDTVGTALGYLFDWLGGTNDNATPDILDLFSDARERDGENPEVIDTEGEDA